MLQNDRKIKISSAGSRRVARWPAQELWISELYDRLRVPARGTETMAEYLSMKKARQDELKDVGGFVAVSYTHLPIGAIVEQCIDFCREHMEGEQHANT